MRITLFKQKFVPLRQIVIPMKQPKSTSARGGRREGAGRPAGDSRLFTFRAPGPLARVIEAQENKTEFITHCIARRLASGDTVDEPLKGLGEVWPATKMGEAHLPFFDIRIVAGFPLPLDADERAQDIDLLRLLCPHPEASYLIRVQGDSMIDANIHSGDIVIVDKSNRHPSESEVAVCELNGEYTLKYFVLRDGQGWLVPANPDYPEIPVREGDDFSVWGTVTYVIHSVHR